MGLLRWVTWALVGPLLLWMALVGHVVYRMVFVPPEVLRLDDWPPETTDASKAGTVQARSTMIQVGRAFLS